MIMLYTDSNGKFPDIDTASCLERIRNWLILLLIGKKPVIANVFLKVTPFETHSKISLKHAIISNATLPSGVFITNYNRD